MSRRSALAALAASVAVSSTARAAPSAPAWRLATFSVDVTPPVGHPLLGGQLAPARAIDDPLYAKGLVWLDGGGKPVVLAAIDWCEIRNDAYERFRQALADAAGTSIDRVLLSSVHQHDAPYVDTGAQSLLAATGESRQVCDPAFVARAIERVAAAVRESLKAARPITHYGTGQAKVERIASNRRVVDSDGRVSFRRYSAARDPVLRELPEGTIDPWLKTLSFWHDDEPVAAIMSYATHPMSYYGRGGVSSDFVGLARARRQKETPHVPQIYLTGCSGDVTAGKYNDGATENRALLADRLHQAMAASWQATQRRPLTTIECRAASMTLPHRNVPGQTADDLRNILNDGQKPFFARATAALGLSSLARNASGHQIDVQAIDWGGAQLVLLPAESFIGFQLQAQAMRPDSFVMAVGFGECAPGYIPTEAARREGFVAEHGYCWVGEGVEPIILKAVQQVLQPR